MFANVDKYVYTERCEFNLYSRVWSCLGDHICQGNVFGQVIKLDEDWIKIFSKFNNNDPCVSTSNLTRSDTPGEMTVTYKADLCLGAVHAFLKKVRNKRV